MTRGRRQLLVTPGEFDAIARLADQARVAGPGDASDDALLDHLRRLHGCEDGYTYDLVVVEGGLKQHTGFGGEE